jgi:hypothetical protein
VAILAAAAVGRAAGAQQQQQPAACTYDTCALRVERGWWSTHLVRGTEGARVVSLGLFAPDLESVVQRSDSAARHARAFRRDSNRGSVLGLVSIVLVTLSIPSLGSDGGDIDDVEDWRWAALAGGFGIGLAAGYYEIRAHRSLERSIWWYNREL